MKSYMITTSYLPRRSLPESGRARVHGQPIQVLVPVEERVERSLVVVSAGDHQSFDRAGARPGRVEIRRQRDRAGRGPFAPPGEGGDEFPLVHRRRIMAERDAQDTPLAATGGDENGLLFAATAPASSTAVAITSAPGRLVRPR